MSDLRIELSDEEQKQLEEAARGRDTDAASLAQRWVRERLVHERERASGTARPMSPRARREAE